MIKGRSNAQLNARSPSSPGGAAGWNALKSTGTTLGTYAAGWYAPRRLEGSSASEAAISAIRSTVTPGSLRRRAAAATAFQYFDGMLSRCRMSCAVTYLTSMSLANSVRDGQASTMSRNVFMIRQYAMYLQKSIRCVLTNPLP